jgi:DNA-binding transcriptional ArsR family regulator
MPELNSTAKLFKALMHPSRLMILESLREGEQCVCHLEAVLGCRQAYISQHLMILRDAGLVEDRREGARIFYRVVRPEVFEMVDGANQICGEKTIKTNLSTRGDCPCPKCNPVADDGVLKESVEEKGSVPNA